MEELKILVAIEPSWIVSVNDQEFLPLSSADIILENETIRIGRVTRTIRKIDWLRPNVVRLRTTTKPYRRLDTLTLHPGRRLPSATNLRRQRREFQKEICEALRRFWRHRRISRQILYADRRQSIGGAYPRILMGNRAIISVAPDEPASIINGVMRAAILWQRRLNESVSVVVPRGRHSTIASRLKAMPHLCQRLEWFTWDGSSLEPLATDSDLQESYVHEYVKPAVDEHVDRICAYAPDVLQPVPHIAGKAVSIRLRGIEVARISETEIIYPLGEPIPDLVQNLRLVRKFGSRHPLARAHEESWLESNVIGALDYLIPSIDTRHIYPQVPSFVGEDRNIVDLLGVTLDGRLVVVEIKASADPELPFQALDYWIAVERHRVGQDFQRKGYFRGVNVADTPAILVLVAPLLAFHRTFRHLVKVLPARIPLLEIGINESWKREIKILRRIGRLG